MAENDDLPAWFARAVCGSDEAQKVNFFPKQGEDARPAKDLCARCPVRDECLEFGMTQRHGIWGGMSERERRRLRRERSINRGAA